MRIGEILKADYRVPEEAILRALHFQRTSGSTLRLGEILVKLKVLPRRELLAALGQQMGVPVVVGLARMPSPPRGLLSLVTRTFSETRRVVPIGVSGPEGARQLLLAMADPTDFVTIDVVERATGSEVVAVVALEEEIAEAIARFYDEEAERSISRPTHRLPTTPTGPAVPSPRRAVSPSATRPSAPIDGEQPRRPASSRPTAPIARAPVTKGRRSNPLQPTQPRQPRRSRSIA